MREGERQGDHRADIVAADGVTLEPECRHRAVHVFGKACLVVAAQRAVGMTGSAQIESDDGMPFGERRHDPAPFPPGLRKAMQENERRPVAADDGVDLDVAGAQYLVTEIVQLSAHCRSFR